MPMESQHGKRMGKGGLHSAMSEKEFDNTIVTNLNAVPYIKGINNHMGSQLTEDEDRMSWLMQALTTNGDLYFVDSRTTSNSRALKVAQQYGLDNATRDVFLDHDRDPEAIKKQFDYLIKRAHKKGSALAIGHPYPETMAVLEEVLPTLESQGVKLVYVSELIEWREQRRSIWLVSLSLSRKVVKN